jgi:hypothetical protein
MLWKFKIETLLKARELWSLVGGTEQKLVATNVHALVAYTKWENRALNIICQSLSDNQLMIVCEETIAKDMWEALEKQHLDRGLTNRLFSMRRFFICQMGSNETMEQHVDKLSRMVQEFDAIKAKVPLEVKAMVLLMNLPNSYKLLVMSLESYQSTRLTWEVVITKLLNEKLMTRKNGDGSNASNVTLVHTSHRSVGSKETTRDRFQDIYNYCKKKGHRVRN